MRLIKLSFKNLNSLVGTWSIDFDHPAYRGDGIFAISGPTGAGKSSILDAICLALYKASPRLKEVTKGSNELMSRGTGDCFSELTFETRGRRLTARFAQSRAHSHAEGALQDATWTLSENGRLISDKARDTKIQIEAVLSLDFDQFTRAILLAQGNFAAFLKASPAEQADLLEKMTGTEIYQQIGEEIHDITAEKRQALEHCDTLLGGHLSLGDDERAALAAALDLRRTQIETRQAELKHLLAQQTWQRQLAATEVEISTHQEAFTQASHRENQALAELAPILQRDTASRQLDLASQDFHHQQEERQKLLIETHRAAQLAVETEAARIAATRDREATQTVCAERKTQLEQERQDLQHLRQLLREEAEARQGVQDRELKLAAATESEKRAQAAFKKLEKNRQSHLTQEVEAKAYLEAHAVDAQLGAQIPLLDNQLQAWSWQVAAIDLAESRAAGAEKTRKQAAKTLEKLLAQADQSRQLLEPLQSELSSLESARQELSAIKSEETLQQELEQVRAQISALHEQIRRAEQVAALEKEDEAIQIQLTDLTRKLAGLEASLPLQQKLLADKVAAIEQEQERQHLLSRIASLETQRHDLQSGQPCPLCGSEEHPYARYLPPPAAADTLRRLKSEHKVEAQNLDSLTHQHSSAQAEVKFKQERRSTLKTQLASLPRLDLHDLRTTQSHCQEQVPPLSQALQKLSSLRLGIDALRPKLAAAAAKLQKCDDELIPACSQVQLSDQEWRHAQDDLAQKLDGRQTQELALLAATAPFLPKLTAADLKMELLDHLLQRAQAWQENAQSLHRLAPLLATANAETNQAAKLLELGRDEIKVSQESLQAAQSSLAQISGIRKTRFGDKVPESEEIRLAALVDQEEKKLQAAVSRHSAATTAAELAAKHRDECQRTFSAGTAAFQAIEALWLQTLSAADFADETARRAVQLPTARRLEADKLLKDAGDTVKRLQNLIAAAQIRLAELQQQSWAELSAEALALAITGAQDAINQDQQQLGADKQKLSDDEVARQHLGKLQLQRQAAAAELLPWDLTKSCIDSKDGLKRFAQGLTLERLLGLANQHLLRLRPRYQLSRENELIRIIDTHHGDAVRPIANLSGGESFLVSLSLALGLSDMASRKIELGCLFLDEGFGTLDADSLQQALDALSHLQQHTGKLIGLISHIDSLKEVLPVQIRVNPVGRGRSEISGPGVEMTAAPAPSVSRSQPLAADIHAQVLGLLDQHPSLKSSLLQEQLKITPSQASKVLKELVESGQLRSEGKGKGMIYLADRIEST